MKVWMLLIVIIVLGTSVSKAQIKETVQLATLSPSVFVIYSDNLENYEKNHYLLSTIGYMGSYMILESKWKAALLTLALGATKELVYDELLNKGTPLWSDMKWNTLGVTQGFVFTVTISI